MGRSLKFPKCPPQSPPRRTGARFRSSHRNFWQPGVLQRRRADRIDVEAGNFLRPNDAVAPLNPECVRLRILHESGYGLKQDFFACDFAALCVPPCPLWSVNSLHADSNGPRTAVSEHRRISAVSRSHSCPSGEEELSRKVCLSGK